MATVTISHCWDDGQVTEVSVEVDASYPDALAEAKATATATMREVLAGFDGDDA